MYIFEFYRGEGKLTHTIRATTLSEAKAKIGAALEIPIEELDEILKPFFVTVSELPPNPFLYSYGGPNYQCEEIG